MTRRELIGALALAPAVASARNSPHSTFQEIVRPPDRVTALVDERDPVTLRRDGSRWTAQGISVAAEANSRNLPIRVTAPNVPLAAIRLRWNADVDSALLALGDAWERSYGELQWRSLEPERPMPWYFATHDGRVTHSYGVAIGAAALCFWQLDREGVTLSLNLRNGGMGVLLGDRELLAAEVICRQGHPGEHPNDAIAQLCRLMCPHPRLPAAPVYGTNDWYYAYGRNTAAGILRDTDLVAALAPSIGPRPFSVVDDGWETNGGFPDMARLAEQIRERGAHPGVWIRPLEAKRSANAKLLLPANRYLEAEREPFAYDPTVPEAREAALTKVEQAVRWNYELIKHDFTTYDLLGRWGFHMGAQTTKPGWSFHDRTKTTAEIIRELYRDIRQRAGEKTLILGCNTVGHLAAGLEELQRTGDDTSGRRWERTRRMGVNTLAYRLPQNKTFFVQDADCVGITGSLSWERNRDWMDLVARSGSALFLSPSPDAIGPEQRRAIQDAFAIAAAGRSEAQPIDWTATTPEAWQYRNPPARKRYRWCADGNCDPDPV